MKQFSILCFFIIVGFIIFGCKSKNNSTRYNDDIMGCTDSTACNYNPDANVVDNSCIFNLDVCGVCGGSALTESDCPVTQCGMDVCISIINVDMDINKFDIWMVNSVDVAGFQFKITGLTISSISGGTAEEYGLSVSSGSNNLILGFSFGGGIIPIGNGILFQVTFSNFNDDICFTEPIFSGQFGSNLSVILGECYK